MRFIGQSILLVITFFVAFLITTALTDKVDNTDGYYDSGRYDARSIGK